MEKNKEFLDLMAKRGVSPVNLATKLGVSERAVQYWIKGRNKPSIVQLLKMEKIFHVSVKKLYSMFKDNEFKI